ncbi:hypothetical protein D9611_006630 [Ephemerocybe angulata]|uniref:Uncharacterized protein n=1 Tax=Ephemerocybe angulata TaxID=980116 RepID=A0A8H5C7L8_9AGAR|nr:hypothetical protein D9611_006630 [Tulosesus angulatus]
MASAGLHDDLDKAYHDYFEFNGSSHHLSAHAAAPNALLKIEGIKESVTLPLTESTVDEIARACESQSPSGGLGQGTAGLSEAIPSALPNPVVLEGSKFWSGSYGWDNFVQDLARGDIWETLGAPHFKIVLGGPHWLPRPANYCTGPRWESVGVTLHRPGPISHNLLAPEGPKPEGAFATIVFILPSEYEGGQVHLSTEDNGPPVVLDTSTNSSTSTYVLAWYDSLTPTIQPITSGYRLAITYNLIHTDPKTTVPIVPTEAGTERAFRAIFQKWKDGGYAKPEKPPFMGFAMRKSECIEPSRGVEGFEGKAAAVAKYVLPIAESLGFRVCFASLTKTLLGHPHHEHWTYDAVPDHLRTHPKVWGWGALHERERNEKRYWAETFKTPPMGDFAGEGHELEDFRRLDGEGMPNLGKFGVLNGNMVPLKAFWGTKPQPGARTFLKREVLIQDVHNESALVFYRPEDETDVILSVKGAYWFLRETDVTNEPTPQQTAIVAAVLQSLGSSQRTRTIYDGEPSDSDTALALLDHASDWEQAELWNKAILYCDTAPLEKIKDGLEFALEKFEFAQLKDGLFALVKVTNGLARRYELSELIAENDPEKLSQVALSELAQAALDVCKKPTVADVPALVSYAQSKGPESILSFLSRIEKKGMFEVLFALAKGLHGLRQLSSTSALLKDPLGELIYQCLGHAILQWDEGLTRLVTLPDWNIAFEGGEDKVKRVCELIEFSFSLGDFRSCVDLFNSLLLLKKPGHFSWETVDLYERLLPHLKIALADRGVSFMSEPFVSFYRNAISVYLQNELGAKVTLPPPPPDDVRCRVAECKECAQLQTFLQGENHSTLFTVPTPRRNHVLSRIKHFEILAEHLETEVMEFRKPYTLVVKRSPKVVDGLRWQRAKPRAEKFLESVCAEREELEELMGVRYTDVVDAVEGTKAFVAGDVIISLDVLEVPLKLVTAAPAAVLTKRTVVPSSSRGSKRKRK